MKYTQEDYEVINKSEHFDKEYYLRHYPDVKQSKMDPIVHYLVIGAKEKYNPSAKFNTGVYCEQNPDVEKFGFNPLLHFLRKARKTDCDPLKIGRDAISEGGIVSPDTAFSYRLMNDLSRQNILNLPKSQQVPIIIIAYNNLTYLQKMLGQLKALGINKNNIWVWDNLSTSPALLDFYERTKTRYNLVQNNGNYGPRFFMAKKFFDILPKHFAVTDPDLEFNKKMPRNFIETLKKLTLEQPVFKAGLALDISPHPNFREDIIAFGNMSIRDFEQVYWEKPLPEYPKPKVYDASIDTTFAVYNKDNICEGFFSGLRVADNFTCRHLPWYKDNRISDDEKKALNTDWSHWNK
ncbi:MAG: hypothetical protein FWF59_10700 [Turicibacter sp.]|nr:hypothetical protein [Turicibacter sp.]